MGVNSTTLPFPKSRTIETLNNESNFDASRSLKLKSNHVPEQNVSTLSNETVIPDYLLRYIQFHRESIADGKVKNGVPFLVYRCYGGCAGLGGRIKAMIKSFYAAVCAKRVFLIDSPFPLPLQDYLAPNMIEWNASYPNEAAPEGLWICGQCVDCTACRNSSEKGE